MKCSKIRRFICLFLSASLFIETGYAAPGLDQATIKTAKQNLNKVGMGKPQPLGVWFEKSKPYLDEATIKTMTPWVNENKNKLTPPLEVTIKNNAKKGKYLLLTFKLENKKTLQYEVHRDTKGAYISTNNQIFRPEDVANGKLLAAAKTPPPAPATKVPSTYHKDGPFLSFKEFKARAKEDPQWGVRYINALRKTVVEMEKNQKQLLFSSKAKKTSSFFYDLNFPQSYAAGNDDFCLVAGWFGRWNPKNGHCEKGDKSDYSPELKKLNAYTEYTCPQGNDTHIDCNPEIFGYQPGTNTRICVEKSPKENVSINQCEQFAKPIRSTKDLVDMANDVDRIEKLEPNLTYGRLKHLYLENYKQACLDKGQLEKDAEFIAKGQPKALFLEDLQKDVDRKIDYSHIFNKKFKETPNRATGEKDMNYHSRRACEAVFRRLAFLDLEANPLPVCAQCGQSNDTCKLDTSEKCYPIKTPSDHCKVKEGATDGAAGGVIAGDDKCKDGAGAGAAGSSSSSGLGGIFAGIVAGIAAGGIFCAIFCKKGDKGDKGDSVQGPPGQSIKGDKGDKGDPGESIKGDKGDKGDPGETIIIEKPVDPPPVDPPPVEEPIPNPRPAGGGAK